MRGIGGETKANLMASRTAKLGLPEGGVCGGFFNDGFFLVSVFWNFQKTGGFGEPPFFLIGWLVFRSFTTLFFRYGVKIIIQFWKNTFFSWWQRLPGVFCHWLKLRFFFIATRDFADKIMMDPLLDDVFQLELLPRSVFKNAHCYSRQMSLNQKLSKSIHVNPTTN